VGKTVVKGRYFGGEEVPEFDSGRFDTREIFYKAGRTPLKPHQREERGKRKRSTII